MDFILVHGGGHGAWCWEPLISELKSRGHRAFAWDLPGGGDDPTPPEQVATESYLRSFNQFMQSTDISSATLMGHSIAGFWLPEAVQRHASRIRETVFLAAAILAPGERGIDLIPQERRARYLEASKQTPPVLSPSYEECRKRFFNDFTEEEARVAFEKLRPQSLLPYLTAATSDPASLPNKVRYLLGLQDVTFPPETARGFAAKLGVTADEIDAAHDMMLSQPSNLADYLVSEY